MSANVLARQTEQISETDVAGELQAAKAQIRRLTKSQTEAEEKVGLPFFRAPCLSLTVFDLIVGRKPNGGESLKSYYVTTKSSAERWEKPC